MEIDPTHAQEPDPRPRPSRPGRPVAHGRGPAQGVECPGPRLVGRDRRTPPAKWLSQENTKVDDLKAGETISWTQLDAALPMPIDLKDPVIALAAKASDVEQALNQQILKVTGLEAPRYQLTIDGKRRRRVDEGSARRRGEPRRAIRRRCSARPWPCIG